MSKKVCTNCSEAKDISDFGKHTLGKYGVRSKCKVCTAAISADWYKNNKEKKLKKAREWSEKNKERHAQLNAIWYSANKVAYNARKAEYRVANIDAHRQRSRDYYEANKGKYAIKTKVRRRICRQVTPAWANRYLIEMIYKQAAKATEVTGDLHHVDHIVPLVSPMVQSLDIGSPIRASEFFGPLIPVVQGLHCESNLRVLGYLQNIRKRNLTWPDMPNFGRAQLDHPIY